MSKDLKTVRVDTLILGFAKITQQGGKSLIGLTFSPLPDTKAVPPTIEYGTSVPIFIPNSINSSTESPNCQIWLSARRVAAASVLPPPKPAATGIFFSISTLMPALM